MYRNALLTVVMLMTLICPKADLIHAAPLGGIKSFVIKTNFLDGQTKITTAHALNSDGSLLAVAFKDRVNVWNVDRDKKIHVLKHDDLMWGLCFLPPGDRLATASGANVVIWDLDTGEELMRMSCGGGMTYEVASSPDGRMLASAGRGQSVTIWHANNGELISTLDSQDEFSALAAFSPDGERVAASGKSGGRFEIRIWRVADGMLLRTISDDGTTETPLFAFHPDGNRMLIAWQGRIDYLDIVTGAVLNSINTNKSAVTSLVISTDGTRLYGNMGGLSLWRVEDGRHLSVLNPELDDQAYAFSDDGRRYAAARMNRIEVMDSRYLKFHQLPFIFESPPEIVYEPNVGSYLFCAGRYGGRLHFVTAYDHSFYRIRLPGGLHDRTVCRLGNDLDWTNVAVNPTGTRLAYTGWNGTVKDGKILRREELAYTLRPDSHAERSLVGRKDHMLTLEDMAYLPDGEKIIGGTLGGYLIKGIPTGTHDGHEFLKVMDKDAAALAIALAPDGRTIAVGGEQKSIKICDLESLEPIAELKGHKKIVTDLAYHEQTGQLISAGEKDLICWDVPVGTIVRRFDVQHPVRMVAISPDGSILATAGNEGDLTFRDYETGGILDSFELTGPASCLCFHPLGYELGVATGDGRVLRLNLQRVPSLAARLERWRELARNPATGFDSDLRAALMLHDLRQQEQRHARDLATLEVQHMSRVAREIDRSPKSEFETSAVYEQRRAAGDAQEGQLQAHYEKLMDIRGREMSSRVRAGSNALFPASRTELSLGTYDVEKQRYPLRVQTDLLGQRLTEDIVLGIPPAEAQHLKENLDRYIFTGKARLRSLHLAPPPPLGRREVFQPFERYRLQELDMRDPEAGRFHRVDLAEKRPIQAVVAVGGSELPPVLDSHLGFEEPSGNDILDADEEGAIWVSVTNTGQGSAFDVRVEIDPPYLEFIDYTAPVLGEIPAGETSRVKIPLFASTDVVDGVQTLTLRFPAGGFEAPTKKLTFSTRRLRPPDLNVVATGIDDGEGGNGIIEPREVVTVTARIQNLGQGAARGVQVRVRPGDDVVLAPGSATDYDLGRMESGEYSDIQFDMFTNQRAEEVDVELDILEALGRFGKESIRLDLAFDRIIPRIEDIVVTGRPEQVRFISGAEDDLTIDIEQDIPRTRNGNPHAVALIMGISHYDHPGIPSVRYAGRDAHFVRRYVELTMGYAPENILPSNPDEVMTAGKMKRFVRDVLPAYLKPDGRSELFVYFSGHGAPSAVTGEAFLVPADCNPNFVNDNSAYSMSELCEDLAKLDAKSSLLVLDACFSGSAGDGQSLLTNMSPLLLTVEDPLGLDISFNCILSSAQNEVSNWYPARKHGLFTYFFLKGLRGEADGDGDGVLTLGELESYVLDSNSGVPYWSNRVFQRPQTPVFKGERSAILVRY